MIWIYIGLTVTFLYLVLLLVIANYGSRITEMTTSDFFVAGGSLSSVVIFLTMIASAFSAFTFLGGPGIAYSQGIGGIVIVGAVLIADLPLIVILGEKIWKISKLSENEYITPADLLCDRFADSSSLRIIVAFISIGFTIFYITIQFTGIGLVLTVLTDGLITRNTAAILIGIVMAVYVSLGGMRGVAYTDALQAILLWFGMLTIVGWVLWTTPLNVFSEATQQFEKVSSITTNPLNTYTAAAGFGASIAVWPHIWQRFYSTDRISGIWAMGFGSSFAELILLTLFTMIVGFAGLFHFPNLSNPDTASLQYILEMPGPLLGVLMAAAVAAAMSTADSQILMMGSIASRDIYQELVGTNLSEDQLTVYSRIIAGVLGLIALAISLLDLGLLVEVAIGLAIPGYFLLLPPTLAAFFWPRANWQGAVAGLVTGLISLLYYQITAASIPFNLWVGMPGLIVCISVLVIVSLVTPESDEESIAKFVYNLREYDAEEVEEPRSP